MAFRKLLVGISMAAALAFGPMLSYGQDKKEPAWKDQGEFDLVSGQIGKATDPAKKLELLNQWKEKYPTTDFSMTRLGQFLITYQALGKAKEMYGTAKEIAAAEPNNFTGPYYMCLLTPSLQPPDPAQMEEGDKACGSLQADADKFFDASKKPAAAADADWAKQKKDVVTTAYNTRTYVAQVKKDPVFLEERLRADLTFNPAQAQKSYLLGAAILGQKKVERQPEAIWQFARACALTGEGSLPEANKKPVCDYFAKVYGQYRGNKSGMDKLLADAAAAPFAPAGFVIKTQLQEDTENMEKIRTENPKLYAWIQLKSALADPKEGAAYFNSSVKDAALPDFKGKIISMEPATNPKKLVVGVSEGTIGEVTITLADGAAFKGTAPAGTDVTFKGVGRSFTADPFNLTIEVERKDIEGWPTPGVMAGGAPAGGKKAAPAGKKAAGKRK